MKHPLLPIVLTYDSNQDAVVAEFVNANLDDDGDVVVKKTTEIHCVVSDEGGITPYTVVVEPSVGGASPIAYIQVHTHEYSDVAGRVRFSPRVGIETWTAEMTRLRLALARIDSISISDFNTVLFAF